MNLDSIISQISEDLPAFDFLVVITFADFGVEHLWIVTTQKARHLLVVLERGGDTHQLFGAVLRVSKCLISSR